VLNLNWNYHSHTLYTDGSHTVEEIASYCDGHGIKEIAITEHVKRELSYDFDALLSDIKHANSKFKVNIITGLEAKILPDGTLDCTEEIKSKVDIVIGSVHSLNGMDQYGAYEKLARSDCMIIGHPQLCSDKIIASMVSTGKIVELSARYDQQDDMIMAFKEAGLLFSIGLDSHKLSELDDFDRVKEMIQNFGLQDRLWKFTKNS